MKSITASNLWLYLPGQEGYEFDMGEEELIVPSAQLDSFGAVPAFLQSPEMLLCRIVVRTCTGLSEQELSSVLIVFYGARYNAQDGARNLFFAFEKSRDSIINKDPFPVRKEYYEKELEKLNTWIARIQLEDFYKANKTTLFMNFTNRFVRKLK